ncbi:MAG: CopG family transcriptional regulator [Deltaproteobacteria bacterium]|nr:MAG: CopG family transcriptional regulator [Deltaproteobacteria bacterium]RLB20846.1 MAG: CopG family transcriptional regulator [Deltaproteobacteria bacterium]
MKRIAKNNEEFDKRFDEGEDIHDLIDMSRAKIRRPGKKVRISLDIGEELLREIDSIRAVIGVDRSALIKVWLHERVQKEKALRNVK